MASRKYTSNNNKETEALGRKLAQTLVGGESLAFIGNLGSGKTTFVKGLARGLSIKQTITSPTFVLMKVYKTKHKTIKRLVHIDCYRVPGIEFEAIGLIDYLNQPDTVVAIEWAEKLPKKFKPSIILHFNVGKKTNQRTIRIKNSPR